MSKQSKQPTKRSARLLQRTNKPELESIVHDKPQEHQSSLLPQPLVSIELIKRHPNIHLPGRLSRMPSESSNIMKSEDFDRIKEVDDLESENRSLNEEIGVLMQINELFDKESIVFQNQIKELEIKLKIANQEKGKSRANKLLELPVKAFNISNKNEETYFYVDEDEETSDNDDSDSKEARDELKSIYKNVPKMYKLKADQPVMQVVKDFASASKRTFLKKQSGKLDEDNHRLHVNNRNKVLALLLNTEVHSSEISETDENSQEKKQKIIVYNYS
ncbi:hypothetical protein C2G38_2232380 [Gigaspora rosea]|uniref:Uncharacterized protein n=1 Tax=Gigaspora rosea TaxID=44941 RepID=A0A397TT33_9GLOM|nr:hypothetical protein C2G38_2232380 [Gigaspora rosea]